MSPETQLPCWSMAARCCCFCSAGLRGLFSMWWRRGSRGVSIVRPGSQCPNCGLRSLWLRDPLLLGWLLLRGRCRQCRLAIPLRYLLMEWGSPSPLSAYTNLPSTPLVAEARWIRGLKPLGARESAFYLLGVLADVGLCRGVIDFRTYHILCGSRRHWR